MTALIDHAAAVVPSVDGIDLPGWLARFDDMFAAVVAPAFFRREPRMRARAYLLGLVSGLERKNGWTLAALAPLAERDAHHFACRIAALRAGSRARGARRAPRAFNLNMAQFGSMEQMVGNRWWL